MTIKDKKTVRTMLENGGQFPGDPPAAVIYRYTPLDSDLESYAIFYDVRDDDMYISMYVKNPVLLMRADGVLTDAGRFWLAST